MKKTGPLIIVLILVSTSLLYFFLWRRDPSVAEENALMENVQAMCLLLAIIFVLARALTERAWSISTAFFFLSFLTIFLRELDLRPFPLPRIIILLSTKGRNIGLTIGWTLFLFFFVKRFRDYMSQSLDLLKTAPGRYFALGCAFYLLAFPFDRHVLAIATNTREFIEELLENAGTLFFVFSSIYYCRQGTTIRK